MSLRIRRLAISNFRKFRDPFAIEGLSDGLNIIIEPNETGKSTVLEALRAAFFVRHSTKNQLASSYAPYGENVAPEIEVGFDIAGEQWSVAKKLLKSPLHRSTGPHGTRSGRGGRGTLATAARVRT
jgi:predicted ATP-dependent endonuclease of OLD family